MWLQTLQQLSSDFPHSSRLSLCLRVIRKGSTGECVRPPGVYFLRRASPLFGKATSPRSSCPSATALSRSVEGDLGTGNQTQVLCDSETCAVVLFFSSPVLSFWPKWSTRWRRTTAGHREFISCVEAWPPALRQWSVSPWTPWGRVLLLRENPRWALVSPTLTCFFFLLLFFELKMAAIVAAYSCLQLSAPSVVSGVQ